jgi:hypothetical protein
MSELMKIVEQRIPTKEEIAERAYHIYLARGKTPRPEIDDWLQAEYELMQVPIRKLAKIDPLKLATQKQAKSRLRRSPLIKIVQAAMMIGV